MPSEQESADMSNRSKEAYKDENAQLKKRIKELAKALVFGDSESNKKEIIEFLSSVPDFGDFGLIIQTGFS